MQRVAVRREVFIERECVFGIGAGEIEIQDRAFMVGVQGRNQDHRIAHHAVQVKCDRLPQIAGGLQGKDHALGIAVGERFCDVLPQLPVKPLSTDGK